MTTKKRPTKAVAGQATATHTSTSTSSASDHDAIYTAHQVHTLAHLTFQQLAAASRWMQQPAGPSFGSLVGGPHVAAWPGAGSLPMPMPMPMMHGCAPHPSQVLLYWYP